MLDYASQYMHGVLAMLRQVMETQHEGFSRAADCMTSAVRGGGRILLFGTGHSHLLAVEGHHRAGGLAAVTPILHSTIMMHESAAVATQLERTSGIAKILLARYKPTSQDCLVVISNSGVNAVPVEMAQAGKAAGMQVIALVAFAYAQQAPLSVVGLRLPEIADIVLDNGGIAGDALVEVGGGAKSGATSTVVGAFILNALFTEVAGRLGAEAGQMPPIYISSNMPGASEHNHQLMAQYAAGNPHL
ncbi:MAG: sugar isomerase domain-containing protein [Anaerolineae bacterium]